MLVTLAGCQKQPTNELANDTTEGSPQAAPPSTVPTFPEDADHCVYEYGLAIRPGAVEKRQDVLDRKATQGVSSKARELLDYPVM